MKPVLRKGNLAKWNDNRGFGFIQPSDGSKEVFLHISALKKSGRRPKVGDPILYELTTEADGKLRASNASIEGIAPRNFSSKPKGVLRTYYAKSLEKCQKSKERISKLPKFLKANPHLFKSFNLLLIPSTIPFVVRRSKYPTISPSQRLIVETLFLKYASAFFTQSMPVSQGQGLYVIQIFV